MFDWHPVNGSGFKLSAGVAYNGNKLKARGTPDTGQGWNGRYYTVQEIGTIHAKMKLGNPIVPIVTIGYDSSFITSDTWSFNTEVGVMFVGKPKTTISVTGIGANNSQLISDVKSSINHANKYLRYFPILNLGFKYHL
jgi:hypothetical protein